MRIEKKEEFARETAKINMHISMERIEIFKKQINLINLMHTIDL